MSNHQVLRPGILDGADVEVRFMQSQTRGSRRVQLKRGESVKVRFLPAQIGPQKRWYARIANHWILKKPVVCPVLTAPDYGGNEDFPCPLCKMSEELNKDANKNVSDFGWDIRAIPQWLTYCVVFAKSASATDAWQEMPLTEVVLPWEFQHYKSSFETLYNFVRNSITKDNPLSVLDYERGNDFIISKQAKGSLQMDKRDSEPIFDPQDPNFGKWIEKLEAGCKTPQVKIPDLKDLDDYAFKAQETAYKEHGKSSVSGVSRGQARAYRDEEIQGGGYVEDDRDEQPSPRQAVPARRPAANTAPAARRTAPVRPPEDEPALEQDDSNPELAPVPRETAPVRRAVAPARPVSTAPTPPRAVPATRAPAPLRRVPAVAEAAESLDPDEQVAPEDTDQAPPEDAPLAEGESEVDGQEPPPVAPARKGTLGTDLRRKITSVQTRRT